MICPNCKHIEIIVTERDNIETLICATCGTFWDTEMNIQGKVSPEYIYLLKEILKDCEMIDNIEVEVVSNLDTTKCIACDGVALKTGDDDYVCNKCGQSWSIR